jgi:hypothetical protein
MTPRTGVFTITRCVAGHGMRAFRIRVGEGVPLTGERRIVVSSARQCGWLADEMKYAVECRAGLHNGSTSSVGEYLLDREPKADQR